MNAKNSKVVADNFNNQSQNKQYSYREYMQLIDKINSYIDSGMKLGKYSTTVQLSLSNTAMRHNRMDDILTYLKKNKYTVTVVYLNKTNQFFNLLIQW